jgi:NTE family protein
MAGHVLPEEIWVIQINRAHHSKIPETPSDIFDRRNQLAGNLSLQHELELIRIVNLVLQEPAVPREILAPFGLDQTKAIGVRFIRMSPELSESLDYPTKISRQPDHIARLIADGVAQAIAFLATLDETEHAAEPGAAGAGVEPVEEHGPMGPV